MNDYCFYTPVFLLTQLHTALKVHWRFCSESLTFYEIDFFNVIAGIITYHSYKNHFNVSISVLEVGVRAMSTNSLFLPHKVMYHIAVAKCYVYVILNFMWKKKRVRRHSPKYLFFWGKYTGSSQLFVFWLNGRIWCLIALSVILIITVRFTRAMQR